MSDATPEELAWERAWVKRFLTRQPWEDDMDERRPPTGWIVMRLRGEQPQKSGVLDYRLHPDRVVAEAEALRLAQKERDDFVVLYIISVAQVPRPMIVDLDDDEGVW